jgi:hypothetical protein
MYRAVVAGIAIVTTTSVVPIVPIFVTVTHVEPPFPLDCIVERSNRLTSVVTRVNVIVFTVLSDPKSKVTQQLLCCSQCHMDDESPSRRFAGQFLGLPAHASLVVQYFFVESDELGPPEFDELWAELLIAVTAFAAHGCLGS